MTACRRAVTPTAMCNLHEQQERAWAAFVDEMRALGPMLSEPVEIPSGQIHPSEPSAVVSAAPGGARADLLTWGWKPASGRGLIINIRSEGRRDPPPARG